MNENINELEFIPAQRPVFLKVLCILTFIGSGYGVINSTVTYFKVNEISKFVTEAKTEINEDLTKKKKARDPESVSFITNVIKGMSVMSDPENLRKAAIGNFITSIFCLVGAVLMWNLRRTGFYIYTLGTIISIVLPFYIFGNSFLTNISAGFLSIIGILFVIFYAMNIKSLK